MVIINVMNIVLEFVSVCSLERDILVLIYFNVLLFIYIYIYICYGSKSYKLLILKLEVLISINMLIFNPQISL